MRLTENIEIHNDDCNNVIDRLIYEGVYVPLIIADPPYDIKNTTVSKNPKDGFQKEIQSSLGELKSANISDGFDVNIMRRLIHLQKNINIYIWCNKSQIPWYLDYYVNTLECNFEILKWVKTNAIPTFSNKYLSDTEYCLYFRKGGYCKPVSYEKASTLFSQPINIKDKQNYDHPTIKPLEIISTLIENSSVEGDLVFDPFLGSGTTAVSCEQLDRKFIGTEISKKYFDLSVRRIKDSLDIVKMEL